MIRITIDTFENLDHALGNLESLGVKVDKDFPPISLDLERRWFLVRAMIPAALAKEVDNEPGIELFQHDYQAKSVTGQTISRRVIGYFEKN